MQKYREKGCSNTTCSAAEPNTAHSTSTAAAVRVSAQVYKLMSMRFWELSLYNNLKKYSKALQLLWQLIQSKSMWSQPYAVREYVTCT